MVALQKGFFIIYATSCVPLLSFATMIFSCSKVPSLRQTHAQKCHSFVRHMLKNATGHHYCDLKSLLPCYNNINTYGLTCHLSLYLTTIKCGAHLIPTAFLFSCKIIRLLTPDKWATLIIVRQRELTCGFRLIFVI